MIILRQKEFSSNPQKVIREIKKEFPKFKITKPAEEYFKTFDPDKINIIAGNMCALDLESIIMMNKMLPSITDNGSSRLIVACSGDCEELICIENNGEGTIWQLTSKDAKTYKFTFEHSEPTIQEAIKEYSRAINGITGLIPANKSSLNSTKGKHSTLLTVLGLIGLIGLAGALSYLLDKLTNR